MRRNLRLFALLIALYYFVSAGFSWYEDWQADKHRLDPQIEEIFAQERNFSSLFEKALPGAQSSPLADGSGIEYAAPSPRSGTVRTVNTGAGALEKAVFSANFSGGLDDQGVQRLKAFFQACENTTDERTLKKLSEVLGLDKKSVAELHDGMTATTRKMAYALKVDGGNITVTATRTY